MAANGKPPLPPSGPCCPLEPASWLGPVHRLGDWQARPAASFYGPLEECTSCCPAGGLMAYRGRHKEGISAYPPCTGLRDDRSPHKCSTCRFCQQSWGTGGGRGQSRGSGSTALVWPPGPQLSPMPTPRGCASLLPACAPQRADTGPTPNSNPTVLVGSRPP
ncbi:hypothetical protein JYU34_022849 [Plutella xylostella]|uniref:Uncharacterized protein n=1 Tax=Plutella xylostella TaxID=51655 RepID=A0ABQ7PPD7_PLUXY|nr:hypothetical protein JYU34_022849 [Plutella xylostella]